MRDLCDASPAAIASERSRVAYEGWGRRLLELQDREGQWGGGAYSPKWISTTYTLLLLRHLGIDPEAVPVLEATEKVKDNVIMGRVPFFEYMGEVCVSAMALACASYFGHAGRTPAQVDYLLTRQLDDGGWNCDAPRRSHRSSFHTTISVLEALLEYESVVGGRAPEVRAARLRAHGYLLERSMFRSMRSGEVINPRWKLFSFPPRWHYDILRGLDYLQADRAERDPRCDEAVSLVEAKSKDGLWQLQNRHPGREHFSMEESGKPSRWNTLRALRVLRWYRQPGR